MQADLKNEVIARWVRAGGPAWTSAQTLAVAEQVDDDFQEMGRNPTPRFHEERMAGNHSYLNTWIAGCHFEWLNPRGS